MGGLAIARRSASAATPIATDLLAEITNLVGASL